MKTVTIATRPKVFRPQQPCCDDHEAKTEREASRLAEQLGQAATKRHPLDVAQVDFCNSHENRPLLKSARLLVRAEKRVRRSVAPGSEQSRRGTRGREIADVRS